MVAKMSRLTGALRVKCFRVIRAPGFAWIRTRDLLTPP
jgi:hypothetical protein